MPRQAARPSALRTTNGSIAPCASSQAIRPWCPQLAAPGLPPWHHFPKGASKQTIPERVFVSQRPRGGGGRQYNQTQVLASTGYKRAKPSAGCNPLTVSLPDTHSLMFVVVVCTLPAATATRNFLYPPPLVSLVTPGPPQSALGQTLPMVALILSSLDS